MRARPRITAIVPTLDEAESIAACLSALRAAGVEELVVVDGGSRDRTVELAARHADRVVVGPPGLFPQLNRGAQAASGEVLLFHFADGTLDPDGIDELRASLDEPGIDGGAFRLRFSSPAWFYRAVEHAARLRNRCGLGPFGDQSIFVRAAVFRAGDGFRPGRVFADHEFARLLRRRRAFRILRSSVVTSVRRWERRGRLRTLVSHWFTMVAYVLGARTERSPGARAVEALRRVR